MLKKVLITTGDSDGIGLEVSAKALEFIGPKRGYQFVIFRSKTDIKKYLVRIDKYFQRVTFNSYDQFLSSPKTFTSKHLIDIKSDSPPTEWVFVATRLGMKKKISALVTAPLSKTESFRTHKVLGHTDVFRRHTKKNLFMYFIGTKFNTLLMTDHLPLIEVPKTINKKLVRSVLSCALEICKKSKSFKKIALIGLNPHSGEQGLLGTEEIKFFLPEIKKFNLDNEIKVEGPLVPDVAFTPSHWKKYSLFVSPYHDQGLTAFKLIHGQDKGIQYTAGLPFVRTSVDHGTAKDLYNKDRADFGSMKMAIETAMKFTK